jgi:predicted  nucleic acid-binding Zn-ribbon protein
MAYYPDAAPSASTDLAFDLRQIYAKIVGEHMLDISEARKSDNLYIWYKALEDLHTVVKHKFKHLKEDEKEYNTTRDKVTALANKYKNSWLNINKDGGEASQIEEALRQLEELLYSKMSEAKMFGEGGKIAGL